MLSQWKTWLKTAGAAGLLLCGMVGAKAASAADPVVPNIKPITSQPVLAAAAEASGCAPEACGNGCADGCAADGGDCCDGRLLSLFDDCCGRSCLRDHGFGLRGWTEVGFTYNGDHPNNDVNTPVGANDLANEGMLNQVYFILSRDAKQNEGQFGIGMQMDVLVGHDSNFTTAAGWDNTWAGNDDAGAGVFGTDPENVGIAMPQMYASFYAPIGNGLDIKVGHFYTIIGYEVVTAPDNFFYSHAYTMQYSEPFTHTGALASYKLGGEGSLGGVTLTGGMVSGWDDFENEDTNWSFLGSIGVDLGEDSSITFAIITGDEPVAAAVGTSDQNRTMYSVVYTRKFGEKLTYVFHHDFGRQQDVFFAPGAAPAALQDTEWYGINQYLFYDVSDTVRAGMRLEWWRDDDNYRLGTGAANYYNVTCGLNIKLHDCMMLRPELRWDWADNGSRPYDNGTDANQFLVGTDFIIRY